MKVYQKIARTLKAMESCNETWQARHEQTIEDIEDKYLPSVAGFDAGCNIDLDKSRPDRIVINCPYHCMNDAGYYDGWIYPAIIVTPSLAFEFNIKLNWRGYRGRYKALMEEQILDEFCFCLIQEVD